MVSAETDRKLGVVRRVGQVEWLPVLVGGSELVPVELAEASLLLALALAALGASLLAALSIAVATGSLRTAAAAADRLALG